MADKKSSAKQGTPAPAPKPQPQLGDQYMVKHPSIGGQWQICTIVPNAANEGAVLVQFPDGTMYAPDSVEMNGPIRQPDQTAPGPGDTANGGARVSPLNPEYEAFRSVLTQLNAQSRRMFGLPLSVLIQMMTRLATQRETEGGGHMGEYSGITLFVPDQATFDLWLEDYLLEIQTREAGNSPE